jgi:hypothetical protein
MFLPLQRAIGALFNLAGLPGFVRPCEYQAASASVAVAVRTSPFYTVITVNGVDVYFHRLNGGIDGIGLTQASGCKQDSTRESVDSAEQHADAPAKAQN